MATAKRFLLPPAPGAARSGVATDGRAPRDRVRDLTALVLLAGCAFLVASLATFHVGDPPAARTFPPPARTENACGIIGSAVAGGLLEAMGLGAWACVALLAVLDGPSALAHPGGRQHPDEVFSFVGDNRAKGVSSVPALTLHANPSWSLEHWDDDPAALESALRAAAAPYVGDSALVVTQVKRWRFATPRTTWPDPVWQADSTAPLVFAGDAFAGPRIEGAFCSGLAAAHAIGV